MHHEGRVSKADGELAVVECRRSWRASVQPLYIVIVKRSTSNLQQLLRRYTSVAFLFNHF